MRQRPSASVVAASLPVGQPGVVAHAAVAAGGLQIVRQGSLTWTLAPAIGLPSSSTIRPPAATAVPAGTCSRPERLSARQFVLFPIREHRDEWFCWPRAEGCKGFRQLHLGGAGGVGFVIVVGLEALFFGPDAGMDLRARQRLALWVEDHDAHRPRRGRLAGAGVRPASAGRRPGGRPWRGAAARVPMQWPGAAAPRVAPASQPRPSQGGRKPPDEQPPDARRQGRAEGNGGHRQRRGRGRAPGGPALSA